MKRIYDETLDNVLKIRDNLNKQIIGKSPAQQSQFIRDLLKNKNYKQISLVQETVYQQEHNSN